MQRYGHWLRIATTLLAACAGDGGGASSDPNPATSSTAGTGSAGISPSGAAGAGAAGLPAGGAGMGAPPRPQPGGAGAAAGAGAPAAGGAGAGASGAGGAVAGRAAVGGMSGQAGSGGEPQNGGAGGQAGRGGSAAAAGGGAGSSSGSMPVHRVPLRVHTAASQLTEAELGVILAEVNEIWLVQAGVCFEIEVTASETNRSDGFDFRYTSGQIPGAGSANGVFQGAHSIWSIDRPRLADVMKPVKQPAARTTAHELGHALGLAHENPPPSNDCASPCHCTQLGDDCDEYLMRSGTKGIFLSKPEIEIARGRATRVALPDKAPTQCAAPMFMR